MLEPCDSLVLADGVALGEGRVVDAVAEASWPVNASGSFVLERTGCRLESVVAELAAAFALPLETAREDVLAFAWQLNRLGLVNVRRGSRRLRAAVVWVRLAVRLAPSGTIPSFTARRRRIDTTTPLRAFASVVRGAAGRGTALALGTFAAGAHLSLVTGRPSLLVPAAVGVSVGAGVVVHEGGHAAALVGIPGALVIRGHRIYVLHAPTESRRRRVVAAAGPALTALIGLVVLTVLPPLGLPALGLAGAPAAVHACALTVLAGDGRTACGL